MKAGRAAPLNFADTSLQEHPGMKREGRGGGDSRSGEAGAVLDDACEVVGVQCLADPARLEPRVGTKALAKPGGQVGQPGFVDVPGYGRDELGYRVVVGAVIDHAESTCSRGSDGP